MDVQVVGINHKTAPIEIREKYFLSAIQQELLLSEIKNLPLVSEALILSTCNRTEIYCYSADLEKSRNEILKILFSIKGQSPSDSAKDAFYTFERKEAIEHLFRVTAGLDSLVLGEKQILGQVKDAVELSRKKGILGRYFNILSNFAIRTGKKAHSETNISFGGVSISWAAVNMAESVLKTLKGKSVAVLGAGKMSELATDLIHKKGATDIFIMNRTESCAMALAKRFNGEAVAYSEIKDVLEKVDVCICSVGAPHYILERGTVEKVMAARLNKKLVLIDISMPRNIDPQVSLVPGVLLFHIDDLDQVVTESMKKRQSAVESVEKIVGEKISQFYQKIERLTQNTSSDYFEANRNS